MKLGEMANECCCMAGIFMFFASLMSLLDNEFKYIFFENAIAYADTHVVEADCNADPELVGQLDDQWQKDTEADRVAYLHAKTLISNALRSSLKPDQLMPGRVFDAKSVLSEALSDAMPIAMPSCQCHRNVDPIAIPPPKTLYKKKPQICTTPLPNP